MPAQAPFALTVFIDEFEFVLAKTEVLKYLIQVCWPKRPP
jgi:hypothetical protein